MKSDLIVKIEVPTTLLDDSGKPRNAVGTAYPLREGLVITARHVLYHEDLNTKGKRVLTWRKGDSEPPYFEQEISQSNIVLESTKYDIALIKVKTPEATLAVIPCRDSPATDLGWEAIGYAKGGKVATRQRVKISAKGTFHKDTGVSQRHLDTGESPETDVWKGISGAPVFKINTNELTGVLTHGNTALPGRLMMTSLSWLLEEGRWPEFRTYALGDLDRLISPPKTGNDFTQYLTKKITRELKKRDKDTQCLREQLAEELDESEDLSAKDIATALVGLPSIEAIDTLTVATEDCVIRGGMRFKEIESIDEVKETAQQILGWLVLGSLDEQQLGNVIPHCVQHDSFYFTLAVKSLTGVEVVMARRFNRQTHLEHQTGSEQKSRYLITVPTSSLKWDGEESAWRMFSTIWNKVFPNEKLENKHRTDMNKWNWVRLNDELVSRREDSNSPEHYYIPFNSGDPECAELGDYIADVYRHFLSKLDQMTVIQYGEAGSDNNLFFIRETQLQSAINKFYRGINGEKG